MRFLYELGMLITEADTHESSFDLYPVSYDSESGASFAIDRKDSDDTVAKIIVRTLDGVPIDALAGDYDYKDVYVDIEIDGDVDNPKNKDLIDWSVNKFKKLGYNENTIRVDGDVYHDDLKDRISDINDMGEPQESDSDMDFSQYWGEKGDDDIDIDSLFTDSDIELDSVSDITTDMDHLSDEDFINSKLSALDSDGDDDEESGKDKRIKVQK